jgi:hypothetical protein
MVLIARSTLVEQPRGLFDQKPRHPAPDDAKDSDPSSTGRAAAPEIGMQEAIIGADPKGKSSLDACQNPSRLQAVTPKTSIPAPAWDRLFRP